ncbi:hypothetical protein ACN2C7_06415 [Caulobacter sp. ErkDOM-E]|uniref:hypothetical protein n=1 Tax=Caulobacter sp. ErkDOM-E TaxID=3402778 RepID=UPI003AF98BD6
MCAEDRDVVQRLAWAGITLSASLDVPGGSETVPLDVEQAVAYMADPKVFSARYFGISVDDYEMWVASGGLAHCVAPTKAGERCRNLVRGAKQLSARQWGEHQAGLCALHERGQFVPNVPTLNTRK